MKQITLIMGIFSLFSCSKLSEAHSDNNNLERIEK